MFGRRTRKHTQALEDLREEFSAADRNARAVLTDAMAQIELRMVREREDREVVRSSTEIAIENAESLLTAQAMDVGRVLEQVANTCALVVEQVEADRLERRVFVEAIGRLAQAAGTPLESRERPLGGTVLPASEIGTPAQPRAESDTEVRASTEPPVDAEDSSPAPDRAERPPPDETIDLRTSEERPRRPRTIRRWATKRS